MLSPASPYPQVGSYALYEDPERPVGDRGAELARILELGPNVALISFPLREGAGGNRRVPLLDLIDATPLTQAETREMHDLQRQLFGREIRSKKLKADQARHDALRARHIWSGCMKRQLERLEDIQRAKAA